MAVDDLPLPVVNFLNVIGVEWPYLNEMISAVLAGWSGRAGVITTCAA
ncbi:MAG TPA: hypothetical protein VGS97_21485 [Actinocrinis sp.]|nr:hypothetical protein [Actinocrinis sp.]HEV2346688.1 hypothetical protein [Actinocrinis sp.]